MTTLSWKVYGIEGHRQRESFSNSYIHDFSRSGNTQIIEVFNADTTHTNDYTIVRITAGTANKCKAILEGQLSDGIFENSNTGRIEPTICLYKSIKNITAKN